MPFIDLSSPSDGSQQNQNQSGSVAPNIPSLTYQEPVSPQASVVQPAISAAPQAMPDLNPVPQNKTDIGDEHVLMRNVPEKLVEAPTSISDNGIVEMMGPPLPGQDATVVQPVKVEPEPQIAPIVKELPVMPLPATPVQVNPDLPVNPVSPVSSSETATLKVATPVVKSEPMPSPAVPNAAVNQATQLPPLPVQNQPKPASEIELVGSAAGKQEEVVNILNKADQLIKTQVEPKIMMNAAQSGSIGTKTAGEKFFADRATIEDFLDMAEEKDASDLHLSVGYPPMLRIDGQLVSLGGQELTMERIKELFAKILSKEQEEKLQEDLDIDFSYSHRTGTRFRVNVFHKKGDLAGAFRLIPSRIRTLAELGLPEILYDFTKIPHGLVLVAGPTGNGKSTTLASMLQEINLNYPKHIITIEDPIEYVFPKAKALVDQREVGADVTSFTRALREVLRQDPNVVLVGEMRDFETIAAAITVAETGHLVFSTLHTNSAAQSIDRMIDVFPDAQQAQIRAQLANVLSAVVSQRLVPVNKGGRRAVMEIMIATPAVKNAIREAKTYQIDNIIQTNAEMGMVTLEKSLIELIRKGDLTVERAQNYTTKPDELLSLMKTN